MVAVGRWSDRGRRRAGAAAILRAPPAARPSLDSVLAVEVRQRALEIESRPCRRGRRRRWGDAPPPKPGAWWRSATRPASSQQIEVLDAEYALAAGGAGFGRARWQAIRLSEARLAQGPGSMNAIEVRHLTSAICEFVAVKDVSFDVGAGEIFGFLGSNGAGKVHDDPACSCGLLQPTSGTARRWASTSGRPEGVKRRIALHVAALLALREADRRSEHRVLRW